MSYELFTRLHRQEKPLLLGNAWDVHSARFFERAGYQAIGTSSAAIANALGYEDGEKISFDELFFVVERIARNISIPLSVDFERGYGATIDETLRHIDQLLSVGIVGINLEDSVRNGDSRGLDPVSVHADKIRAIKAHLAKTNRGLFINARTDAYIVKNSQPIETTLERIKAYEAAGADGIFVPFATEEKAIQMFTAATQLPVNVLNIPGIPSYARMAELGVKRVSMGASAFRATYRYLENTIGEIRKDNELSRLW